jgi:flagellar motor protein MotB
MARKLFVVGLALGMIGMFASTGCDVIRRPEDPRVKQLEEDNRKLRARLDERGKPVPPPVPPRDPKDPDVDWTNVPGGKLATLNGVLFASGSADLTAAAKRTIDAVAKVISAQYPGNTIVVRGHTDNEPISKSRFASNQALSEARAQSVTSALKAEGLANPVEVKGYGDTKPVASNATPEGRHKNRRVEILISTGAGFAPEAAPARKAPASKKPAASQPELEGS